MTMLKKDRVIKFRERLYQKTIPRLLRTGSNELGPIKRSKIDQDGNTVIKTKEIISFFHNTVKSDTFINADQYFASLHLLFEVLSKDSEPYKFTSDVQISVEDINQATGEKAIEYLTNNLIISFFENLHPPEPEDPEDKEPGSDELLEKNLKKVISKANEGRDYRTLVGNTLQTMVKTLQEKKPWRESLNDIQTASLVCRLVGAKLPQIDKTVLSTIVLQARSEIEQYTAIFTKILNTRTQQIKEEKNQKIYLKTMKKLDTATHGVLNKIDTYLSYAHTFIAAIGASTPGFLGPSDAILKQCIATLFFEYQDQSEQAPDLPILSYSSTRYRMGMLLDYPELTKFALTLKQEKKYADLFTNVFSLYYQEIIHQMSLISRTEKLNTGLLSSCIDETIRLIQTFDLKPILMGTEKKQLKKKYLSLIRLTHHERLPAIIDLKEKVSQVTQDETRELIDDTRRVLIDNCYSNFIAFETKDIAAPDLNKSIRKLILSYSMHYKPQRFFFQNFFTTYVGEVDDSLATNFSNMIQTKKMLALALLTLFSDNNHVGGLLSNDQIEYAGRLLNTIQNK